MSQLKKIKKINVKCLHIVFFSFSFSFGSSFSFAATIIFGGKIILPFSCVNSFAMFFNKVNILRGYFTIRRSTITQFTGDKKLRGVDIFDSLFSNDRRFGMQFKSERIYLFNFRTGMST